MLTKKICFAEAVALILILIINRIILGLPKSILVNSAASAGFIIILVSIFSVLVVWLVNYLFRKFMASDILDVSEFLAGKWLKILVGILYVLMFIGISILCLSYICDVLKSIYFENFNKLFLALFFIIGIVIANRIGFNAILRTNYRIVIVTTIMFVLMLLLSSKLFVPERFFPLFGYGVKGNLWQKLTDLFAFSGLSYIMLIFPFFKDTKEFYKTNLVATILLSIYLLISCLGLLLVFPNLVASESIFNIYILGRLIHLSQYLQNTDGIYLLFWVLSVFSYLSINVFFITYLFQKITNSKNTTGSLYGFCLIIWSSILLIDNITAYHNLLNHVYKYYMIFVIACSIFILLLANVKKKKVPIPSSKEASL